MKNLVNNTINNAISQAVANCTNNVSLEELENISSETITTCNLSELLSQKREEVKNLESVISECEAAKAATEAAEKAEAEKEAKFISSLTNSEREALAYLEGLQVLAQGEMERLVAVVLEAYRKYNKGSELVITANVAAYVAILIKEEQQTVINLLESITIKVCNINKNSKKERPDVRLDGLVRILMAVQELY